MKTLTEIDAAVLERTVGTGEKIVVVSNDGSVRVGWPHSLSWGLNPETGVLTHLSGFDFSPTVPAWNAGELFEPEEFIEIDSIVGIHIIHRSITPV